jgi:hypothetical protein
VKATAAEKCRRRRREHIIQGTPAGDRIAESRRRRERLRRERLARELIEAVRELIAA